MKKIVLGAIFFCLSQTVFATEVLPTQVPVPKDNPLTEEKIELGKQLYFDPRLSSSGTVSCNSCHNVMAGGEDNRNVSVGIEGKTGGRSAPTVWNSAFYSVQFWDGRAPTLEEQAKGPITNPVEMGMPSHKVAVERIKSLKGYEVQFKKVFGGSHPVNIDNIAKAIASYERTLVTPDAPFDLYLKGDKKAMTEEQIKGFELFKTVGCTSCHTGPIFAGPTLPIGTGFYMKFPTFPGTEFDKKYEFSKDLGRYEQTKNDAEKNMWRVPTLRNVALTAPYFHNGSVKTLDEAVKVMAKTQLNKDLNKDDAKKIAAFLHSLTGKFPEQKMPRLPMN